MMMTNTTLLAERGILWEACAISCRKIDSFFLPIPISCVTTLNTKTLLKLFPLYIRRIKLHHHSIVEKENKSKFMNEVYKTASPGTSSVERQDLIEEHTWTPNGKGIFFSVIQKLYYVRKLWWFPLVYDYHHNCSNSIFFLHVLDCCRPTVK